MSVPSRSFLVVPSVWLGVQVLCLSAVAASKARLAPYPATRSSDALVESPFRYLGPSGYPNTMAIRGDSVFIGGNFKGADGLASGALLLWNGKKWSEPFPGIDYGISGMKWSGDRLYVTGYFREAGGDSVDQAVYWEKGTWHGMGPGLPQYDFPGPIALLGDTVLTASRSGVFRWTGSGWVAFGQPLEGEPLRLENYGGTLWLTGKYATKTGQANLMRWDNGVWTTPAGTDPDKVIDIAWHGGALYMTKEKPVGVFVSYSTWRYDGKTWEDVTGVILGNYGRMASNGKDLYLTFHSFNVGIGMARWDGNTFQEIQFIPGDNGAGDIASFTASGKLILAGNFLGLGGRRMDYMGSWDGDTWSPLSATPTPDGISQYPTAIASDGKQLFVGGNPI
ncbi:MAG: hypothetical protein ABIW76_16910, partial [Fibrobacteria bacterium]